MLHYVQRDQGIAKLCPNNGQLTVFTVVTQTCCFCSYLKLILIMAINLNINIFNHKHSHAINGTIHCVYVIDGRPKFPGYHGYLVWRPGTSPAARYTGCAPPPSHQTPPRIRRSLKWTAHNYSGHCTKDLVH